MLTSKIEKPWGYEELLEQNEYYVVKRLFMAKSQKCSLQYHEFKDETFIVLSGKLRFYYGEDKNNLNILDLNPGQHFHVPVKMIHRMEGIEDSLYLECSTNHLDDVVRVQDDYGRL
jgi:mannose-6-phosphate isomerase-like protein (cupin superfamily)